MMRRNKGLTNYILIILLGVISFAVYANALRGEFLVDDHAGILNNQRIHDIKLYFSKYFSIRPGVLWELILVFLWHIGKTDPYYYHLFNVLCHAFCAILLFILCNYLFSDKRLSFLSSLIFALHPIHTESVSWISGGPYALSSLFFVATLIFYIKSDKSIFNLAIATLFFVLSFYVGNALPMLPVMLLVYELFFYKGDPKASRTRKIRLFILLLIFIISLIFVARTFILRDKFTRTVFAFRGPNYLIIVAKAICYYLKILYLPIARGLYHPFGYNNVDLQKISPLLFLSLAIITLSVFLFFKYRKSNTPVAFGIAWFFITYLPYSNIIPICNIVSERYMYLPSAGFAIILAYLFLKTWELINKRAKSKAVFRCLAIIAITLFLGSYAILTLKHNIEFSNILVYWESNINNFPEGYMAYNNLAGTLYYMGEREQAIAYCWVSLMVNPSQPHVWCNLGKAYLEKGNINLARDCYKQAFELDKEFAPAAKGLSEIEKILKNKK